jgi:hypothetical protein
MKLLLSSLCLLAGLVLANGANANTDSNTIEPSLSPKSVSQGKQMQHASLPAVRALKGQSLTQARGALSPSSGKAREKVIAYKRANQQGSSVQQSLNFDHMFSIYSAETVLLTDEDQDGYYRSFSLIFDADYHRFDEFDQAEVYAEFYFSRNAGPWLHYFSSDNFIIHSESTEDAYEVTTALDEGYLSGQYDILIDLYVVGYPEIVASYSSDDNNALYALPLESRNYDIYRPVVIHKSGGSFGAVVLMLILLLLSMRHYKKC